VPAQLYLEGSDQHRGWFQASLIPGVCIDGRPPFETVLTHGFVVDGDGRKMSKSLGNVISPDEIIKNYGADILRLWVASSDYNEDIRISKEILTRLSEAYRKIRNTARFILSNLYDFDPDTDKVGYADLPTIDKWILYRLENTLDDVVKAYDQFEFHKAYKRIYDFCNADLSSRYLDMAKGRLYTFGAKSRERRASQTVMYEVLDTLVRLMAPILVFTADEIWQSMPHVQGDKGISSVHLCSLRDVNPAFAQHGAARTVDEDLRMVLELIPEVSKALEEMRTKGEIGSSFDAQINLLTNKAERYTVLASLQADMPEIFKVSLVTVSQGTASGNANGTVSTVFPDISIHAGKAQGEKCPRCWNYSTQVGQDNAHPQLCPQCLRAIGGK
jgi:isoleucyl-tRNA synthetase